MVMKLNQMKCASTTAHVDEAGIDVVRVWDSNHTRQTTAALVNWEWRWAKVYKVMSVVVWLHNHQTTASEHAFLSFVCVMVVKVQGCVLGHGV